MIAGIGAVAANGMLGLNNWLPWDIPEELAYFERTVAGAALLIGRTTYESMEVVPVDSFVLSRQINLPLRPGCQRVDCVESELKQALATGKPVFVIGGAALYAAAWPYCQRFYLTRIERDFVGDTRFPAEIPLASWPIVAEHRQSYLEHKSGVPVSCHFIEYVNPEPRLLA